MRFAFGLSVLAAALMLLSFTSQPVRAETMSDNGTISGTVTKDGAPVANVEVRVMKPRGGAATQPAEGGKPAKMTPVATGKTDDQGKFTISNVPAGSYNVTAGNKKEGRGMAKVDVKAGETADVTVTVSAAK